MQSYLFLNLVLNMLFVQREHIEVTSVGHVTFNSNAVLPVSDSGVKYVILISGKISRWLLLVMCPLTAMQSYLFLNLVLNMLFCSATSICSR